MYRQRHARRALCYYTRSCPHGLGEAAADYPGFARYLAALGRGSVMTWTNPGGPAPAQGALLIRGFQFASGDQLSELRLHYTTLGAPAEDAAGVVRNAV